MTCIVDVNSKCSDLTAGDDLKFRYSRRRSPGGIITSQTTLCRNLDGKEEGGGGGGGGVTL